MKIFFSTVCALLIPTLLKSQSSYPEFIPIKKGDSWAFCDSNKKMLIPFFNEKHYSTTGLKINMPYSETFPFSGDLGYVSVPLEFQDNEGNIFNQNKFYFITRDNLVVKTSIDGDTARYYWFSDVEVEAQTDYSIIIKGRGKKGFYNKQTGIICLFSNYNYYYPKLRAFLTVKDNLYGLCSSSGVTLLDYKYESMQIMEFNNAPIIIAKLNGKLGVLNSSLSQQLPFIYTDINVIQFNRFLAKKDDKYGILDSLGNVLIPFEYNLHDLDLRIDKDFYILAKDSLFGCLDINGKKIIPFKYDDVKINRKNLALVLKENEWYFFNLKKKKLRKVPIQRFYFESDSEFLVVENEDNSSDTLIDKCGTVISGKYKLWKMGDGIGYFYGDKYDEATVNGKGALIRTDGSVFMSGDYEQYDYHFGSYKERKILGHLIIVKKNEKYGLIDTLKNIIIPLEYDAIKYLTTDIFKVKKGNYYGLLSIQNKVITEIEYEDIDFFKDGLVRVKKNGLYGFINQLGETIIACKYNDADYYFINRLTKVILNENKFYIDDKGSEYIIEE